MKKTSRWPGLVSKNWSCLQDNQRLVSRLISSMLCRHHILFGTESATGAAYIRTAYNTETNLDFKQPKSLLQELDRLAQADVEPASQFCGRIELQIIRSASREGPLMAQLVLLPDQFRHEEETAGLRNLGDGIYPHGEAQLRNVLPFLPLINPSNPDPGAIFCRQILSGDIRVKPIGQW